MTAGVGDIVQWGGHDLLGGNQEDLHTCSQSKDPHTPVHFHHHVFKLYYYWRPIPDTRNHTCMQLKNHTHT